MLIRSGPQKFGTRKELSLCHKLKYWNLYIFRTRCCKPLIFLTQITSATRIHSLKYPRSTIFGCKDIVIIKSEFVATTQFLYTSFFYWATPGFPASSIYIYIYVLCVEWILGMVCVRRSLLRRLCVFFEVF